MSLTGETTPDENQTRLLAWLSLRPQATFHEFQAALGLDEATTQRILDQLLAASRIYSALTDGTIYYRLTHSPSSGDPAVPPLQASTRPRKEITEFLRQLPILKHLSDDELREIEDELEPIRYARDEVILWQGETNEQVYFIESGVVAISRISSQHQEEKLLGYLEPGAILGEYSMLFQEGSPATATATAKTAVSLLAMKKPTFRRFLMRFPGVSLELCGVLVRRLLETERRGFSEAGKRLCLVVGLASGAGATTVGSAIALALAQHSEQSTVYTEQPDTTRLATAFGLSGDRSSVRHRGGYDVLVSSDLTGMPTALRTTLVYDRVAREYTNIVMAVPSAAEEALHFLAERADQIVLVATPACWSDLLGLKARLHTMVHPGRTLIYTVVNRPEPTFSETRSPQGRIDVDLPYLARLAPTPEQTFAGIPSELAQGASHLAQRLGNSHQIGIYIPSTVDTNQPLDTRPHVERALAFLGLRFGGATTTAAHGVWNSAELGLVDEDIHIVRSYASQGNLDRFLQDVLHFVEELREELRQEAMAVEINQKLIVI